MRTSLFLEKNVPIQLQVQQHLFHWPGENIQPSLNQIILHQLTVLNYGTIGLIQNHFLLSSLVSEKMIKRCNDIPNRFACSDSSSVVREAISQWWPLIFCTPKVDHSTDRALISSLWARQHFFKLPMIAIILLLCQNIWLWPRKKARCLA